MQISLLEMTRLTLRVLQEGKNAEKTGDRPRFNAEHNADQGASSYWLRCPCGMELTADENDWSLIHRYALHSVISATARPTYSENCRSLFLYRSKPSDYCLFE